MIKLNVKPLSINDAYKGRRYRTYEYKAYIKECMLKLKKEDEEMFKHDSLYLVITFYMSSKAMDADNPIKPIVDILQKKYGFNDNKVMDYMIQKRR